MANIKNKKPTKKDKDYILEVYNRRLSKTLNDLVNDTGLDEDTIIDVIAKMQLEKITDNGLEPSIPLKSPIIHVPSLNSLSYENIGNSALNNRALWEPFEEAQLQNEAQNGLSPWQIAQIHQRTIGSIISKCVSLGLIPRSDSDDKSAFKKNYKFK